MAARRCLLLPLLVGACAGSSEYTCPDPIGRIIRDDCEVYKTRYESLKVELGASLGGLLEGKVGLGQQSLRDPGELIQMLSHRTFTLCRDFNACRVMPLEYRQRREQTDCIFTAISAIQAQLKQSLDDDSKRKLVKELVRVLNGETCGGAAAPSPSPTRPATVARARHQPRKRASSTYYTSWIPWYGTQLLPPQPGGSGPSVAAVDTSLAHVFRQKSPYGTIGYRPAARISLRGTFNADDMITVDWGGETSDCTIGRGRNNLALARCEAPKTLTLTGASFTIKVILRRGADGKTTPLGTRRVPVLVRRVEDTKNDSHRYGINHDPEADQGLLIFRPVGRRLPPDAERPHLHVVLRARGRLSNETARCWVGGKPVTKAIEGRQGHVGQFQDRPRYRRVKPGSSVGVKDPFIKWRKADFALPFVFSRGGSPPKGPDKPWPLPGKWRCVVTVDGEPVRELRFTVKSDGRLAPHPRQIERPRAAWLLRTRVLENPVEGKLEQ
jgi:hypothetical protein